MYNYVLYYLEDNKLIIALENAKHELQNFRSNIEELGNALRISELKAEVESLEKLTFEPDFWSDQENSTKILQKIKQMKDKIEKYEALSLKLEETIMMAEMAIEENDESNEKKKRTITKGFKRRL